MLNAEDLTLNLISPLGSTQNIHRQIIFFSTQCLAAAVTRSTQFDLNWAPAEHCCGDIGPSGYYNASDDWNRKYAYLQEEQVQNNKGTRLVAGE